MPRSKESSDEVRRKVVEAHKAGKGYKTIAKVLDLHRSTVRQIIYKWKAFNTTATRPRSGRPTKLDSILRLMGSAAELGGTTADGGVEGADTARISDNEKEAAAEDVCRSAEGTGRISGNEDKRPGKYECGRGEEENARVSVTRPETPNLVGVKMEDNNVLISGSPLRAAGPEVTRTTAPKRRRRKEKTKNSKPMHNHSRASPSTPSSSRAPVNPQPETLTPGPAEHQVEDILCCEICGAYFTSEPELEAHQAQHLLLHECEECGKAVQSAAGLKVHKKLKHGFLREHKESSDEAECE
ncbi:uncharacterized protein [Eleutherodactylus coqui]|uniref:uncharacterized protein n=1 Tax=Eleutherodactylus coqui TaxID=57060 RepID=UPI00346299F4